MEHILTQREWSQGRRNAGAPALTNEQKKNLSALHNLAFIEDNYDLRLHYFEPDGLNHRNYLIYNCNLIKE
jgi:hypothetical protein